MLLTDIHTGSTFQQYQLLEKIGLGGQGEVWSALDSLHQLIVAIKFNEIPISDLENKDDQDFAHQMDRLVELRHPHILPVYQYGRSGRIQYLVSPFMPGGTLQDRLKSDSFTTADALDIATGIAAALDYLHAQGVVHRDLKPGNVLMDLSQTAYVADFGLALFISPTTEILHTGRGTPPYAPSEQHTKSRMTPQSDIFSFGVTLYELFTGQLPWKGEKVLGMQQLSSGDEIPDPREINPALPPILVKVLRAMTSADPAARPPTAGEAMRFILTLFDRPAAPSPAAASLDEAALRRIDAQLLLERALSGWSLKKGTVLSLTKFALIDTAIRQTPPDSLPVGELQFMLLHALTYGYNDDIWWSQLTSLRERLAVATALLQRHIEMIGARVVYHLTHDPELGSGESLIPRETTDSLLELASTGDDPFLQEQGMEALKSLTPASPEWRDLAFSPEQDEALGRLALAGTAQSGQAAELIGRLRSRRAVKIVLQGPDDEQRAAVLMAIQQVAGSLPALTPARVRLGVSFTWILQRLFVHPWRLLAGYGLAFLGASLGFGFYAYLAYSYRYPGHLLEMVGINASITTGIFLGAFFGFGLALTRQIASRYWGKSVLLGTLLAGVIGGAALSAGLFVYDVVALNTPPTGLFIPAGCLWAALGFALATRLRSRLGQFGLSLVALFTALAGTWWLALAFGNLSTDLPIISFDPGPILLILGWMLIVALPPAILTNLMVLTDQED
jgi:serine/threonine protein kinase